MDNNFTEDINHIVVLKSIPIFRDLDVETLYQVFKISRYIKMAKGEVIAKKGERGDTLYILLEGEAGVYLRDDADCQITIGPGEILGELSIVDKKERTATIRPLKETLLLEFNGDEFISLLRENATISFSMLKTLAGRLRIMLES